MSAKYDDTSYLKVHSPETMKSTYASWNSYYGTPKTPCANEEYEYVIKTKSNFEDDLYWFFVVRKIQYGEGIIYLEAGRVSKAEAELWPKAPGTVDGEPLPKRFEDLFLQLAGTTLLMNKTNLMTIVHTPQK